MVKRLLITTAIEESWGDNKNVLFLGDWCKLDSRKDSWGKLQSTVCFYHWDDRAKLQKDYDYIVELYERLLIELALKLNSIHQVDLSVRAWRILVGPWLGYFLQMLYDRWCMIQFAIGSEKELQTILLTGQDRDMIPNDMNHFVNLFLADDWNHYIYRSILEREPSVEKREVPYHILSNSSLNNAKQPFKEKLKQSLKSLYNSAASFINGKNGNLFINTYLSGRDNFILSSRYKQLPILQHLDQPPKAEVNFENRQWTMNEVSGLPFEDFAKFMIPKQIPIAYLEGFKSLLDKCSNMSWPSNPSVIFTSNSFSSDDIFKMYAAFKVDRGAKLVIGQHGGHYGIGRWFFNEKHEITISDKFLSWGWTDPMTPKVRRVGQLKAKRPLNVQHSKQPGLLLVTATLPRYSYFLYSIFISSQWVHYFQDQCEFVEKLEDSIRDSLTIRLYKNDFGWNQLKRWRDRFPKLTYDKGHEDIVRHIRHSKIFVSTYNATTYLESFTMDIPTVIYWDPHFSELRDSAIPYFEELKRVGIFHETPQSAANHINSIWNDVDSWWYSAEVRRVVMNFKESFCYLSDQLVDDIDREFKTLISKE